MKNKRLLTAMTLLGLMLTGCGQKPVESSEPPASIDDGDIVRDENGNIIFENVNLQMWSVTTGDDAKTQDDIISGFNAMYEGMINIETRHISRYDLESLLQTTMEFDKPNAPHLLFTHGARTAEYADRGWLQPVDPYYDKTNTYFDKEDFTESLLASTRVGDLHYGVPQDVHSAILEIREDILLKNGLAIPNNYAELVEVSTAAIDLAKAGNLWIRGENPHGIAAVEWRKASSVEPYYPFPFSYGDMWVHEFAGYTATTQNGGKIINESGMPGWNDQGTIDGMQVLKDMIFPTATSTNKYALSKSFGSDYDVGDAPFRNGDAIFKLNGPWVYQNDLLMFDRDLRDDGGQNNIKTRHLGDLFAKDSTNAQAGLVKGEGHAIMITSTIESTTKSAAGLIFADYMTNYSGIEWAKRGHIPALKSVAQSTEYTGDPAYDLYIKDWGTSADYVVVGATKYYTYSDSYYKQALQQALSNEFKDTAISEIISGKYNDCVDYIDLYS